MKGSEAVSTHNESLDKLVKMMGDKCNCRLDKVWQWKIENFLPWLFGWKKEFLTNFFFSLSNNLEMNFSNWKKVQKKVMKKYLKKVIKIIKIINYNYI